MWNTNWQFDLHGKGARVKWTPQGTQREVCVCRDCRSRTRYLNSGRMLLNFVCHQTANAMVEEAHSSIYSAVRRVGWMGKERS
jgi:hypothetical protein